MSTPTALATFSPSSRCCARRRTVLRKRLGGSQMHPIPPSIEMPCSCALVLHLLQVRRLQRTVIGHRRKLDGVEFLAGGVVEQLGSLPVEGAERVGVEAEFHGRFLRRLGGYRRGQRPARSVGRHDATCCYCISRSRALRPSATTAGQSATNHDAQIGFVLSPSFRLFALFLCG